MKRWIFSAVALAVVTAGVVAILKKTGGPSDSEATRRARQAVGEIPVVGRLERPGAERKSAAGTGDSRSERETARREQKPPTPLTVRFSASSELAPADEPMPVLLTVRSNPNAWPLEPGVDARLELLLRLPVGVRLADAQGWEEIPLPESEREDPSGPWVLYERRFSVPGGSDGAPPEVLASARIPLTVVEEGTNWVISCRARLVQGDQGWQTFAPLFATRRGTRVEFHGAPKIEFQRSPHP